MIALRRGRRAINPLEGDREKCLGALETATSQLVDAGALYYLGRTLFVHAGGSKLISLPLQ